MEPYRYLDSSNTSQLTHKKNFIRYNLMDTYTQSNVECSKFFYKSPSFLSKVLTMNERERVVYNNLCLRLLASIYKLIVKYWFCVVWILL